MQEGHEKDPLHGVTLEAMLEALVARHGWPGLAEYIPIRCFMSDPSVKSSLTFLRRTPWARAKVEALYLGKLRKPRPPRRPGPAGARPPAPRGPAAAKSAAPKPVGGKPSAPKPAGTKPAGSKPAAPKHPGNRYPGLFTDED